MSSLRCGEVDILLVPGGRYRVVGFQVRPPLSISGILIGKTYGEYRSRAMAERRAEQIRASSRPKNTSIRPVVINYTSIAYHITEEETR